MIIRERKPSQGIITAYFYGLFDENAILQMNLVKAVKPVAYREVTLQVKKSFSFSQGQSKRYLSGIIPIFAGKKRCQLE
jgi:hypothetical protein